MLSKLKIGLLAFFSSSSCGFSASGFSSDFFGSSSFFSSLDGSFLVSSDLGGSGVTNTKLGSFSFLLCALIDSSISMTSAYESSNSPLIVIGNLTFASSSIPFVMMISGWFFPYAKSDRSASSTSLYIFNPTIFWLIAFAALLFSFAQPFV